MRISKILIETRVLFLIGLIDLAITLILFYLSGCSELIETHKLFRAVLSKGPLAFASVKIGSMLLFLSIIEYVRQKRLIEEKTVKRYLKIGIIAYLSLYVVFIIKVNILPLFQL